MTELSAIAGLNSVVRALTGPRRLRSALRQKTVAIKSLLGAMSGPGELRVRIPAAVFGGDIFGVMSSQLRDALIVPQSAPVSLAKPERRRSIATPANVSLNNPSNPFQLISEWLKPSTQLPNSNSVTSISPLIQSETAPDQRSVHPFLPPETQISRKGIGEILFDNAQLVSATSPFNPTTSATTRPFPATPALVSSLNRYWESISERRDTSHTRSRPVTESTANKVNFPVTEFEQRVEPRTWPTSVGRDVSEKLRSFTNTASSLQKSTRLSSTPDRQIQNVFNIEVNHANHHASNVDDLGDRIAQILHEQALQHGIDVT